MHKKSDLFFQVAFYFTFLLQQKRDGVSVPLDVCLTIKVIKSVVHVTKVKCY